MKTPPHILLFGRDTMLSYTRSLVLGTYFEVDSAGRLSEAISMIKRHDYGLVILCDTLNSSDCMQIERVVGECEHPPALLTIAGPANRHRSHCTGPHFESGYGPWELIRETSKILGFDVSSRFRMSARQASSRDDFTADIA